MSRNICALVLLFLHCFTLGDQRRIGKRHDLSWDQYNQLGNNQGEYAASLNYPDLSTVGALVSQKGYLGTATLIAPNYVVTAAHVVKNSFYTVVNASEWQFVMHNDISDSSMEQRFQAESIVIHPAWSALQSASDENGTGDIMGVDLALIRLSQPIVGFYPARLPSAGDDPLGGRAVLSGYGHLIEGDSGEINTSNDRRVGGENTIDRSVTGINLPGLDISLQGGLIGIDFDSSLEPDNTLSSAQPSGANTLLIEARNALGSGESSPSPLPLEASTAQGDSGGPAFVYTAGFWRVHGVVSYGTNESMYGDVTLYTRLASHYDWLLKELPDWADSKLLGASGWRQNPWLGTLLPFSNSWAFHINLGWIYTPTPKGNHFWGWSHHLKHWIWLSDQAIPYIYCFDEEQPFWIYLDFEKSDASSVRAYDYSSKTWKNFP
jgi:hypothetical protein